MTEHQIEVNVNPSDQATLARLITMIACEDDKRIRLELADMTLEALSVYEDSEVVIL